VDGNEYIDYLLGGGPTVLGYCHPELSSALEAQVSRGIMFGAHSELEIRLAEKIQSLVPCAERVRFGCTGSEVVHAAVRLARGCTGRPLTLRFEGHYHGWYDSVGWDSGFLTGNAGPREAPNLVPLSPAQPSEGKAGWLILPWNDLALVEDLFRKQGNRIAAILTEPVMGKCGIDPLPGYLEGLREICDRHGTVLIFDEVVTGFRWSLGGAQEYFGLTPDLATFSKGMGSGIVVSALAGRKKFMDRIPEFLPVLAGTFNANALSMAGALATLEALEREEGRLLKNSFAITAELAKGLEELARRSPLPFSVRRFPSSLFVSFIPQPHEPIVDARTAMQTDFRATEEFSFRLLQQGIRVSSSGGWGISAVHTREDVARTLGAVTKVLRAMEATEEIFRPLIPCTPPQTAAHRPWWWRITRKKRSQPV
jgi:glutamate-1-semialdehyde 2,1-aminomutase